MDQDLKDYLDANFARMDEKFERMEERLENVKSELRAEIESVETKLLSAFHGWARGMEIRVRGVAGVTAGFDERLAFIEERVSELERRGNEPPARAH